MVLSFPYLNVWFCDATGNAAYITSKHGVVGLVRAAMGRATALQIKLDTVAPCYILTNITAGLSDKVEKAGLESNTPDGVALAICSFAADSSTHGFACLVSARLLSLCLPLQNKELAL